ncbi:MAG: hypothetical protein V5A59_14380, partial [Bacteroidales bacterium]
SAAAFWNMKIYPQVTTFKDCKSQGPNPKYYLFSAFSNKLAVGKKQLAIFPEYSKSCAYNQQFDNITM